MSTMVAVSVAGLVSADGCADAPTDQRVGACLRPTIGVGGGCSE